MKASCGPIPAVGEINWVLMLGFTAAALLCGGGEGALKMLQAGTIVAALPFTFIVLASGISLCPGMMSPSDEET